MFLGILESSRHKLHIAYGLTLMTLNPRRWEVFPTPGALTHIRIIWALLPSALQVPGVTPGSPLFPWCFGHYFWRGARHSPPPNRVNALIDCCAPLYEECPQHHGHKGDPGVTPETFGAIGKRDQVILMWVRAPGV
jgi:hypothetical protein